MIAKELGRNVMQQGIWSVYHDVIRYFPCY